MWLFWGEPLHTQKNYARTHALSHKDNRQSKNVSRKVKLTENVWESTFKTVFRPKIYFSFVFGPSLLPWSHGNNSSLFSSSSFFRRLDMGRRRMGQKKSASPLTAPCAQGNIGWLQQQQKPAAAAAAGSYAGLRQRKPTLLLPSLNFSRR